MRGFRSPKFLIVTGAVLILLGVGAAGIGMLWGMSQAFSDFGETSQLDR